MGQHLLYTARYWQPGASWEQVEEEDHHSKNN